MQIWKQKAKRVTAYSNLAPSYGVIYPVDHPSIRAVALDEPLKRL